MEFERKAIYIILLLGLLAAAGCAAPQAAPTVTSVPQTVTPVPTPTFPITGEIKATVADDPQARAIQAIVEKWIAAYQNRDAQALLSLYSDKITGTFCNETCVDYRINMVKIAVPEFLSHPEFKVDFQSYTVMNAGTFATVNGFYQDASDDAKNPTPETIILEFDSGKIIHETHYYITSY